MTGFVETFEAIVSEKLKDGRSLYDASSRLNAFWFRNRLPSCDAHDTLNGIDSEGEEYFKEGEENVFSSEDRERFFPAYSQMYFDAIPQLREVLRNHEN